mgnify:CR=1 FL=1
MTEVEKLRADSDNEDIEIEKIALERLADDKKILYLSRKF